MSVADFTNNTGKALRVGYYPDSGQKLNSRLDIILKGFDIEFVSIPDYYPFNINGTWFRQKRRLLSITLFF